jgi:intracellular sulfur oxidation DsrE/DsrF family protein
MQEFDHIDDQMLDSFVDGELDAAGSQTVIQAMHRDPVIRERVYRLRRAKDLMMLGFGHEQLPAAENSAPAKVRRITSSRLVASFVVLIISIASTFFGYELGSHSAIKGVHSVLSVAEMRPHRVILHIDESNPVYFSKALAYATDYIRAHEAQGGEVAVIANAGGIDLMRPDATPFKQQMLEIMHDYQNIHFIACAAAIRELHKKGISPVFFDNVDTRKPAMDQIIEHVQDGWTYIKVRNLVSAS